MKMITNPIQIQSNKILINSTENNIVFSKYVGDVYISALFIPPLMPFLKIISSVTTDSRIIRPDVNIQELQDAFIEYNACFLTLLKNLEEGYYIINFFVFIDDSFGNIVTDTFSYDIHDKNYLVRQVSSSGYTSIRKHIEYIDSNTYFHYSLITGIITNRLNELLKDKELGSIVDLNKKTLLIITKSNKEEYDSENTDKMDTLKNNLKEVHELFD